MVLAGRRKHGSIPICRTLKKAKPSGEYGEPIFEMFNVDNDFMRNQKDGPEFH